MNLSQGHNHQKSSLFFPSGTLFEKCITSCHFKSLKLIIQSSPFFCFFGFDSSLPWGFPGGSDSKESACSAGNSGSIPGSGRSPGEGNANPLQYSCLENPVDGEEPGRLQSKGSQKLRHNRVTEHFSQLPYLIIPTPVSSQGWHFFPYGLRFSQFFVKSFYIVSQIF